LLLDGLNAGGHKHIDGNSISRMCDNGRIWLADASYMNSLPKYHSTILVIRNGRSSPLPPLCEMEHMRDTPQTGFSETTLRDYAGVDWHRNILWLKGKWFVVADELQADEAGDFSFRVLWQTIGKVTREPDGMDVEQAGQHCAIRMTPDLRFTLTDDPEYGANWRTYEFIDEPVVHTLTGIWNGHLEAGEQVTLFTLLHASGEEVSALHLTRLAPNSVAVNGGDDPPVVAAVGGPDGKMALGHVGAITGHAMLVRPGLFAAFDVSALGYQGMMEELPGRQDLEMALGRGDILSWDAGRTAEPPADMFRDHSEEVAMMSDGVVRAIIEQAIATAPAVEPPPTIGGEAPALTELWSYRETLENYLITGNRGTFEAVDTGLKMSCDPEPLPHNVFRPEEDHTNTLDNITDGVLLHTDGGVQWADDQTVTINLSFDNVYDISAVVLKEWFATSSSKGKLFQLGRAVIEASDDGFVNDVRPLVDFTDDEDHGNWGAPGYGPHAYRFDGLDTHARNLRLTLTPRPGTAIYLAEVEVWGNREGLELDPATMIERGLPVHTFADMWSADVDGDGSDEIVAGSTNGKIYLFESDGRVVWNRETAGAVNAVCTADLRGDGKLAIIAGTNEATVEAFDIAGEPLWTYEIERYKHVGRVRDVFPANLKGDGSHAVIVSADSWRYYALDAAGKLIWQYESVRKGRVGVAADLDGDGRDEVICGTEYYWWPAVTPEGKRFFSYSTRTGPGVNDVTVADITGDGTPEVIFGGEDGNVHVLSNQGKLLWQFPTGDEISGLATIGPADGAQTLFAGSRIFNLYALSGDGQALWVTDLGSPVTDIAALRRAGGHLIAATTEDGGVYEVDPATGEVNGRLTRDGAGLTLIAADLDGDGSDEIVLSSADGNLSAIR
ncbi:MAG: PQQ-binding-like beta-propeller repeat protein, partial [Armatimonadetes bacterium]|nr:PQQ-binding-like beta-propeller repeat protein [Armatimonadota bacterium]